MKQRRICDVYHCVTQYIYLIDTYVCRRFMALITAMVLCARSQDSLLSVSMRRVHVLFSTAEFKVNDRIILYQLMCSNTVDFKVRLASMDILLEIS